MPKKIRFPLKLAEGAEARTLDELREHFDLQAVLEYYKSGKLLTWLEDRYLEGEAEAIRDLDEAAPDFQRQLCGVFQVEYTGDDVDMEEVERRQERLKRLRTITDETEYIQNIDSVAFDQEELADLLDEDVTKIYLCGEKFTVPASRQGVTYVGINNPTVHISGKMPETIEELAISFHGCEVDNLPCTVEGTVMKEEAYAGRDFIAEAIFSNVGGVITDNYWLHRITEDGSTYKWYRYDLATGEEIELPEELEKELSDCARSSINAFGVFTTLGDEILCRNFNKKQFFILNIHSGAVERYKEFDKFIEFNAEYVIPYNDGLYGDIKIINRHSPNQCRVLEFPQYPNESLRWENRTLFKPYFMSRGRSAILSVQKIFFVVAIRQNETDYDRKSWLACFDIDSGEFKLITEVPYYNSAGAAEPNVLCVNDSFAYLWGKDGYYEERIWRADLRDSSFEELFTYRNEGPFDKVPLMYSNEYLVWLDPDIEMVKYAFDNGNTLFELVDPFFFDPSYVAPKKIALALGMEPESLEEKARVQYDFSGSNRSTEEKPLRVSNLFAVELSTGKIRTIPIYLFTTKGNNAYLEIYRSTLYCCQPEEWKKEPGERIGYKFNLAAETLEAVEFKF